MVNVRVRSQLYLRKFSNKLPPQYIKRNICTHSTYKEDTKSKQRFTIICLRCMKYNIRTIEFHILCITKQM